MNLKNSYEILPHTADLRLRVKGETLKDLFEQAVLGMARILSATKSEGKEQNVKRKIEIKANDETILLIDFLSEVLTTSYEEKAVFNRIEFEKIAENEVIAEISGVKVDGFDEDIKAVTYHEAEIKKTKEGYETIVVFDI